MENIYMKYSYIYIRNIHIQKGENCAGIEIASSS